MASLKVFLKVSLQSPHPCIFFIVKRCRDGALYIHLHFYVHGSKHLIRQLEPDEEPTILLILDHMTTKKHRTHRA